MREIVLDTETTGLDPSSGHRVVEIGCVELVNRIPSGVIWQKYLNPERDVPREAEAVHGLSGAFLADKPLFAEILDEFLAFLGEAPLVMHNAGFDLAFLNAEFTRLGRAAMGRERVVDTLMLARRRHPGASNRLDDLCVRYGIDHSRRVRHGALLDAELLAEVYAELVGGRQARLGLGEAATASRAGVVAALRPRQGARIVTLTEQELAAHRAFIENLGPAAIWNDYRAPAADDKNAG